MNICIIENQGSMAKRVLTPAWGNLHTLTGYDIRDTASFDKRLELVRCADVICIAASLRNLTEVIDQIRPALLRDHLVFDIGSVKTQIGLALQKLQVEEACNVASVHPMFGPPLFERNGNRMDGLNLVSITDAGEAADIMQILFNGTKVVNATGAKHDEIMGYVQVLPMFLAEVWGRVVGGVDTENPAARQIQEQVAWNIANQELVQEIRRSNPAALALLRTCISRLEASTTFGIPTHIEVGLATAAIIRVFRDLTQGVNVEGFEGGAFNRFTQLSLQSSEDDAKGVAAKLAQEGRALLGGLL